MIFAFYFQLECTRDIASCVGPPRKSVTGIERETVYSAPIFFYRSPLQPKFCQIDLSRPKCFQFFIFDLHRQFFPVSPNHSSLTNSFHLRTHRNRSPRPCQTRHDNAYDFSQRPADSAISISTLIPSRLISE